MSDLIDRQAAIEMCREPRMRNADCSDFEMEIMMLPPIQPEPHEIGYDDCANALLKMWMDNVLTDWVYHRIADKLNEKWGKTELPEPYKGVTE